MKQYDSSLGYFAQKWQAIEFEVKKTYSKSIHFTNQITLEQTVLDSEQRSLLK